MGKCFEPGVLLTSDRFFNTPSTVASKLLYYITRCGHYYVTTEYDFKDTCETARLLSHRNSMLYYVISGAVQVENAGITETVLPRQAAFIDCTQSHRFHALEDSEALWLHIEGCNTKEFLSAVRSFYGNKLAFTPPASQNVQKSMMQLIYAFRLPGMMNEAEQSLRIHKLLCELILLPYSHRIPPLDDSIEKVITFINEHLFEELSVSTVARAVNLSPSHLSRLFKTQTGFSPHEFITLRRIDAAKELLLTTRLSVKQIAYRVGYHSEVNFITSFSGKTGVTPAAFRKNPI